jgi:hypothetical protein
LEINQRTNFSSIIRGGFEYKRISTNQSGERYFVYKYIIKIGGTPGAVANTFKATFPNFSNHQILITDKAGNIYGATRNFNK